MVLSDPVFRSKLRDDLEAFISQKEHLDTLIILHQKYWGILTP